MSEQPHFILDGRRIPFEDGQTLMVAALEAGVYIPHLCFNRNSPRTVVAGSVWSRSTAECRRLAPRRRRPV